MIVELETKDKAQGTALGRVLQERFQQDQKWGSQRSLPNQLWLTILMEEVGEIAKAELEHDHENLTEEVIQVCAVALAWLEGRV